MACETAPSQWDVRFKTSVATTQNVIHAAMPIFADCGCGRVVNIGAISACEGQANMSAYGTAMRITESFSKERRNKKVNVSAVLAIIIDAPRNRAEVLDADFSRWVGPDDLADVICFLGSDTAAAIHGALLSLVGLSLVRSPRRS